MSKSTSRAKEKILSLFLSHLSPQEQLYVHETFSHHPQWSALILKSVIAKAKALSKCDADTYQSILRHEQKDVEDFLKKQL
jgi:hypothetical protein